MTLGYEWLALGAAACWALGSFTSAPASAHLGAIAFSRWRMLFASLLLGAAATLSSGWGSLTPSAVTILVASGLIGIFLGDSALFGCMNRLGPRRSGVLFATHSLFSAVLAWWWLDETFTGQVLLGALLLVGGVMLAILLGKRVDETHSWEQIRGSLAVGVALGVLSALCQAVATLMVKPLMGTGVDPVAASAVRMCAGLLAHGLLLWSGVKVARPLQPINRAVLLRTALNAALAMGLGMTLILAALRGGSAGLVAVLSSVTPVLLLPLLWLAYRRQPPLGAWLGAALTVAGGALILVR